MKKYVPSVLCVLFVSFFMCNSAYSACNCNTLEEVMKITLESVNENAKNQVDVLMEKPDMSSVTDCLAMVRAGLEGSFTLGLPSIESILNGICNAVMDLVYDTAMTVIENGVATITGSAQWLDFFGINWDGSFGLTTNDGNSMWSIDGDVFDFTIVETDVDLSGSINDLFN